MDQEKFEQIQLNLGVLLACLSDIPLDEYIKACQRTVDVGAILHPTEWIKVHEKLEENLRIARAIKPAWDLAKKLKALPRDPEVV